LNIPDLKLSSVVVEGVSDDDLRVAAGHIPGTAMPSEAGNVAIAGHRDTFFRPLRLVRANQIVSLATSRGERRYRVVSTEVVDPSDVRVLDPVGHDTLTLVTCFPFYFVGHAPKRFIVHADQIP
jgi:sortase A